MLDCQLYGLNSGLHHMTNLLFHLANTLLLFFILKRMTKALWQSAFVAALFALHPLHVESVAWTAERKDVLSTLFWMLTTWSYVRYVERPEIKKYLLTLLFFILGLMSKPMLVTLPFVLLLLDYWPMKRFQLQPYDFRQLVFEKLPLFFLSAVSCTVTYLIQQSSHAVVSLTAFPFLTRLANAMVSYVAYIVNMVWPYKLSAFYPHPMTLPWWQVAGSCLLLALCSLLAVRTKERHPYFAVGWLWYIGTLVPVIGLVQVGSQAMADRYTYIPLIGIAIIVSWGVPKFIEQWRYKKICLTVISAMVLSTLSIIALKQVRYWSDSISLFEHSLHVTNKNYVMHNNLGLALAQHNKLDEAIDHYSEALQIHPGYTKAHCNLGIALDSKGNYKEAASHFSEALQRNPGFAEAHNGLGLTLAKRDGLEEAIKYFYEAIRIDPGFAEAHNNLGVALMRKGNLKAAIEHFQEAQRIKPEHADVRKNLQAALVLLEQRTNSPKN
jgi:Flp pilus assembly protein TadD